MKNKLIQWIINSLLVLFSIVVSLVLAELILRACWTPWKIRNFNSTGSHPVYGFSPLPGVRGTHYTPEYEYEFTNSRQGFRFTESIDMEKDQNRYRVLFLGDSFTYGVGTDDSSTFVGRIQESNPDMCIINSGCNGYGTRNALAVLDFLGREFRPNLTVCVFFWNDLSDNLKRNIPEYQFNEEGNVVRIDPVDYRYKPLHVFEDAKIDKPNPYEVFYLEELISEGFKTIRYKLLGMKLPYAHSKQELDQAWKITETYLQLLQQRAKELESSLLIVSLPDHNQVNPDAVIKNITPMLFDVQDQLSALCQKYSIDYLDLLPSMKEAYENEKIDFFFFADRHLTPKGNEIVANLLQPNIQRYAE